MLKKNDNVTVINQGAHNNKKGVITLIINDPEEGIIYMVRFSDTHKGMFTRNQLVLGHICDNTEYEMDTIKRIRKEIALLSPEGQKKLERRGREAYNKLADLRVFMVAHMINGGLIHKEDLC